MSRECITCDFQVVKKEVRYTLRIKMPEGSKVDVNKVYAGVLKVAEEAVDAVVNKDRAP